MEDFDERPIVLDGYSSVQAIRRAQRRAESVTSGDVSDKQVETARGVKSGARIDHTVVPQKHEIVCCECNYLFMVAGRIRDTTCPKCHRPLKVIDHVVDGELTESIRTIGTVNIKESAVIDGAEIRARDIILAGNAEKGTLKASRKLELCPGAKFNMARTRMKDLVVRRGGEFNITSTISCRDLEVNGTLKAKIYADGMVAIRHGGILDGELHTPHLVVEDGGGLEAKVVIGIGKDRNRNGYSEPEIVINNE